MPTSGTSSLAFDLKGKHVIHQGANYPLVFDLSGTDGGAFPFGANLVRAQIRTSKDLTGRLLAEFVVNVNTPDPGSLTLTLSAAATTALGEGRRSPRGDALCIGWYDVELYNPADVDDVPLRIAQGRVYLDLNVTA